MFVYLSLASNDGHYLIVNLIITRTVLNIYLYREKRVYHNYPPAPNHNICFVTPHFKDHK